MRPTSLLCLAGSSAQSRVSIPFAAFVSSLMMVARVARVTGPTWSCVSGVEGVVLRLPMVWSMDLSGVGAAVMMMGD